MTPKSVEENVPGRKRICVQCTDKEGEWAVKRAPIETNYFERLQETVANPYIGFTSYQKFRGDPLFPDIVVRPENNMTETEVSECYPVRRFADRDGNAEGFYPDTEVAYIRILWKDFEPCRKAYRYALIEDILDKARANGQTVMLRLMPHSTRACDDVPDWLKEIIPCPERPEGKRVKDSPQDPVFLRYFGEAIEAIAQRFDEDPTLDVMDISITGAWGEGHRCAEYPREALQELADVYTRSFTHTRLIGQVAAPWLIEYACASAPCGWRGDGVGESYHMTVKYPNAASQLSDLWKTAPVSFESFWWLGEWDRLGWSIDEAIEKTLSWHISTFNAKSFPIPEKWRDKIRFWLSRMGYHFVLHAFSFPPLAQAGDTLQFRMQTENCGVAPIYNAIPLRLRLCSDTQDYRFTTNVDIRQWLPGEHVAEFEIELPRDIQAGTYAIELSISGDDTPVVRWETQAEPDGDFLKTGLIRIAETAE